MKMTSPPTGGGGAPGGAQLPACHRRDVLITLGGEDRARYDRLHADTRLRLRQAAADGRPAGAPAPWKRPPAKVGQVTGRLE